MGQLGASAASSAVEKSQSRQESPIAIGIVLHDLGLGGTERIALRLARAWLAGGARVAIFCGSAQGALASFLPPEADLTEADPATPRSPGSRRRLSRSAAEHFAANPVDAVYVPGNFHWCVAQSLARLPAQLRPVIVAKVSSALSKPQRGLIGQWLFRRRMRRQLAGVDALVTLSRSLEAEADSLLGQHKALTIFSPVLENSQPPPVPVPDGPPVLLAVGRLVPEKGFAMLIEAFARVRAPDVRLVIAGEGPDRPRLERLVRRLGLGAQIEMTGYVSNTRPYLDQSRAYVLSSEFEGYPATMVEALAAGRQIIATHCTPAIADLGIAGIAGRAVPVGDSGAMAQAIDDLLEQAPPDPDLLARRVEHHRIGRVAQDYLDLFAQLIAARHASCG